MAQQPTLEEIQNFKGKYPRQLWYLFLIEMWERFTFYGMRALLGLYIAHLMLSANYQQADQTTMAERIAAYEKEHVGEKITEAHPQYYLITSAQKEIDKSQAVAGKQYGIINAFIYMMAFMGGMFADKLFGFRRSIFWGGVLMALGTFIMAVPGAPTFYLGVSILIVGTGFFKPNISTMVGALYKEGDPRRDAGFSLFYSGINLGAFLSGLTIAYIGTVYSWSLGFSLAGVCMLLGLGLFMFTQRSLGPIGLPPFPEKLTSKVAGIRKGWIFQIATLGFIPLFFLLVYYPLEFNMTGLFGTVKNVHLQDGSFSGTLLQDSVAVPNATIYLENDKERTGFVTTDASGNFTVSGIDTKTPLNFVMDTASAGNKISYVNKKNEVKKITASDERSFAALEFYMVQFVDIIFLLAAIIAIAYLVYEIRRSAKVAKEESRKLIAAVILIFFSVVFWSFFEQGGGSLNFFARDNVHSHGLNMTSVNNSINALWVIIFAPLIGLLWLALAKRGKEPNTVVKFGLGFIFLGAGFLVFFMSGLMATPDGMTPLTMFCFAYFVLTIGELCLSPIGLSMVTKLSPHRLYGVMMGTWFLASAYGQYGAGIIGSALAQGDDAEKNLTNLEKLQLYISGYEMIAYISIGSGVLLILISPMIRKLMGTVK